MNKNRQHNYFSLYLGSWVKFKHKNAKHWSVGRVIRADTDNWTQFEFVGGGRGWRSTRGHEIKEVVIPAVAASGSHR